MIDWSTRCLSNHIFEAFRRDGILLVGQLQQFHFVYHGAGTLG